MYQVISDGKLVGLVDELYYIKVNPTSGAFVHTTKEEAEGIAVNGVPFSLLDAEKKLPGDIPVCFAKETDGFSILFEQGVELDKVKEDGLIVSDAVIDLDETTNEKIIELQNAIIELDEKIGG